MKKTYYECVNGEYVPVSEYDPDFLGSLRAGTHLIVSVPGGQTRKYNINPNFAALIAAGEQIQQQLANVIADASMASLSNGSHPLTEQQDAAWHALNATFDTRLAYITYPCAHDIAEAALNLLYERANQLLTDPAVKRSWDHFQTVAAIANPVT